jgi:isopenicillin-N epimerase
VDPWALDPDITYLNHGAFGSCPRPVLDVQQRWRDELEKNPNRFFLERYVPALDQARAALASFLGCDPEGLVFVRNATEGVNAVVRSIEPELHPGDELLVTDHGYNGVRNALEVVAERRGARVVVAHVPFPIESPDDVIDAVLGWASDRTRLALVDHVTSATALVFPIDRIVAALEPDVPVVVDAAHAPGMVPVALDSTGATYTAGNCHKWLCAPKGAGFLYVRAEQRDRVLPTVVSHGWNRVFRPTASRFMAMFDWEGTTDPSAWLSIPDALRTVGGLVRGGWPDLMARNHALVLRARDMLAAALGIEAPAPDGMLGAMATLPLPDAAFAEAPPDAVATARAWADEDPLGDVLRTRWRIEVPIIPWPAPPHRLVRVSAQLYNQGSDYRRLAEALTAELALTSVTPSR